VRVILCDHSAVGSSLATGEGQGLTGQATLGRLYPVGKEFGEYLRGLRQETGRGIKQVGPEVGVSYSYLSKLENGLLDPSEGTIEKLAAYYGVDVERLKTAAGRLPPDVARILAERPEEAVALLRSRFGGR
jgi:transcriptional regulator with XRE-family HTH domain